MYLSLVLSLLCGCRLNRVSKLASSHVTSRPLIGFQCAYRGLSFGTKMGDSKESLSSLEQTKKRQMSNLVWRSVSAQASSREVIEGSSANNVARASKKIEVITDEAVKSPSLDYSHFISLPLAIHPELVDKLFDFQKCILGSDASSADVSLDAESSEEKSRGEGSGLQVNNVSVKLNVEGGNEQVKVDMASIPLVSYAPKAKQRELKSSSLSELGIDKSIFIKPKTFHLTVLMLKLWNKERVALASKVLQSISPKVIEALDGRPISIKLKGLDCMRGSLAKARVVYIPVEEVGSEGRLLRACQTIINAYKEAGLVLEKDAKQTLKLHATVMNARHRKSKVRTKMFDSFDAREIFKQYGSEEWGDYMIREAHLSQRFVFDSNGYYHCCASIPFSGEHAVGLTDPKPRHRRVNLNLSFS